METSVAMKIFALLCVFLLYGTPPSLQTVRTQYLNVAILMNRMRHNESDEVESTGIRPNHDGTFPHVKSVKISEDEKDDFDCFVSHRALKEPVIIRWGHQEKTTESLTAAYTEEPVLEKESAEKHSLYYIYTALSKPVNLPGIYQFTAMGLLDDRQIDSYNSEQQKKIPTQQWMKEKMQEDYWERGTQSRKSKEQWFNVNVDILMKRMRHNESDLHVLQWRHGCEVVQEGDEVKFSKGISEYGYDGENFLSFDNKESQWVTSVDAAVPTKRKWDNVPILNMYTKGYLEKDSSRCSCVCKLKLTCLVTGFYSEDVTMTIRKYRTSLCENEVESTGIRPNHDGTFQLRKSVEINENEKSEYDCFVSHRTFKEPVIV
ncbi:hypothetical protein cypCar_00047870 [Cyprinus carpio]|nr:hypothetical protein cypCar_00047870 [Cyprinus carpio]